MSMDPSQKHAGMTNLMDPSLKHAGMTVVKIYGA